MLSFEEEMRDCLTKSNAEFTDYSGSPTQLDFRITLTPKAGFWLEVKEKRQPTKMTNWPNMNIQESNLFILDDLSARKIIRHAPLSGVAIRNNVTGNYYFIDVVTLFLMPRIRVNRVLNESGVMKGKWMINVCNGVACKSPVAVLHHILKYVKSQEQVFTETACFGSFVDEQISTGGEYRTKQQRITDYTETR